MRWRRPMVTTRPTDGARATEAQEAPPRRVVRRTPGVPGSRAVVGGALIALAAVGTFVSWRQASSPSQHTYAVATHALQPGDPLTSDDIRYEHMDLPAGVAGPGVGTPPPPQGRGFVAPPGGGEAPQDGGGSDQGDSHPPGRGSPA